ncbi:CRE-INX-16 protein, partial [Aphelenchoides avenae]
FPRLSLCDVPIRGLGDSPYYTLQCHLRVNTYNEKVYFAIWWLFAFVAVSTACSFAYYALAFLWPWTREGNANATVARDTMARIFDVYLWIREDKKLPADIAYNVLANLPVASPKKTGLSPSETISDNGNNNGGFGGFGDDGGTTIANSSSGFGGFGDDGGTTSGNNINGFGGFGSNIGGGWD